MNHALPSVAEHRDGLRIRSPKEIKEGTASPHIAIPSQYLTHLIIVDPILTLCESVAMAISLARRHIHLKSCLILGRKRSCRKIQQRSDLSRRFQHIGFNLGST